MSRTLTIVTLLVLDAALMAVLPVGELGTIVTALIITITTAVGCRAALRLQ